MLKILYSLISDSSQIFLISICLLMRVEYFRKSLILLLFILENLFFLYSSFIDQFFSFVFHLLLKLFFTWCFRMSQTWTCLRNRLLSSYSSFGRLFQRLFLRWHSTKVVLRRFFFLYLRFHITSQFYDCSWLIWKNTHFSLEIICRLPLD